MSNKVIIYGKNTWPFTNAAREAIAKQGKEIEYIDVLLKEDNLKKMLQYSDGRRNIPVIIEDGNVSIGFKGRTWGV